MSGPPGPPGPPGRRAHPGHQVHRAHPGRRAQVHRAHRDRRAQVHRAHPGTAVFRPTGSPGPTRATRPIWYLVHWDRRAHQDRSALDHPGHQVHRATGSARPTGTAGATRPARSMRPTGATRTARTAGTTRPTRAAGPTWDPPGPPGTTRHQAQDHPAARPTGSAGPRIRPVHPGRQVRDHRGHRARTTGAARTAGTGCRQRSVRSGCRPDLSSMVWRWKAPRRPSVLTRRGLPRRPRPPPVSHTYLSVPSELEVRQHLVVTSMATVP